MHKHPPSYRIEKLVNRDGRQVWRVIEGYEKIFADGGFAGHTR